MKWKPLALLPAHLQTLLWPWRLWLPCIDPPRRSDPHDPICQADQICTISFALQTKLGARGRVLKPGHRDVRLVESVGRRIVAALPRSTDSVGGYTGHLAGLQWEFIVVQSSVGRARVVPGGKVVVRTGAPFKLCGGMRAIANSL